MILLTESLRELRRWGVLHSMFAGACIAVMTISYIHGYVFTRTEATVMQANLSEFSEKFDSLSKQVSAVQGSLNVLLQMQRKSARRSSTSLFLSANDSVCRSQPVRFGLIAF